MSIYTPVFPQTALPAARSPSSSSLDSDERHKQSRELSRSSRLSQWHLAIATLPEELCPPSAPSSPTFQARSANLQSEIEQAVHQGRNITDFCKLRSSKLGYATKHPAPVHNDVEQGDKVPWILAETEEEWFSWERQMGQRRARQKGKERIATIPPPPNAAPQSAHDKVLTWQARLRPQEGSLVCSAPPSQSTLSFPVVKRPSQRKDGKPKDQWSHAQSDDAPRRKSVLESNGQHTSALQRTNAVHLDTGDVSRNNSFVDLKRVASNPPAEANEATPVDERSENACNEFLDYSALPPPSFPSDLPTSTQKNDARRIWSTNGPPPSLPVGLPTSTPKDVASPNEAVETSDSQEPIAGRPSLPEDEAMRDETAAGLPEHQTTLPSPPSPPYSSEAWQPPAAPANAQDRTVPSTPPNKGTRPLTPPPDDNIPVLIGTQSSPRTPKRDRVGTATHTSAFAIDRGVGSSGNIYGHMTPDAAINGATVLRDGAGLLVYPRTPVRGNGQATLPDPLTTSRRSRPRPRPPSRKHSMQNVNLVDGADGTGESVTGDPSPAKSDRSYFSSPASGSSSGSEPGSGRVGASGLVLPGSPSSPLGLGFTQDPSCFVPLAESTQVQAQAKSQAQWPPSSGSPKPKKSKLLSSQSQSQIFNQNSSQSRKATLASMYNSQFDVDAQIDQLSNFMHRDVDLDAWVLDSHNIANVNVENTDEEAEEGIVEEMTCPEAPSPLDV